MGHVEEFLGDSPTLLTAAAIEYIVGDLAVRLESDDGFSFADVVTHNAGAGWALDIPDAADQWWHWRDIHLPAETLAQAGTDPQVLGVLWTPHQG